MSRIFRAQSENKNQVPVPKGFRKPRYGVQINKNIDQLLKTGLGRFPFNVATLSD